MKLTDQQKIEIMKRFIDRHKNDDLERWSIYDDSDCIKKFDLLFDGEMSVSYFDANNEESIYIENAVRGQVEISCHETKTGCTELFDFDTA